MTLELGNPEEITNYKLYIREKIFLTLQPYITFEEIVQRTAWLLHHIHFNGVRLPLIPIGIGSWKILFPQTSVTHLPVFVYRVQMRLWWNKLSHLIYFMKNLRIAAWYSLTGDGHQTRPGVIATTIISATDMTNKIFCYHMKYISSQMQILTVERQRLFKKIRRKIYRQIWFPQSHHIINNTN